MELVGEDDILILTADHGCDPTWTGTDHTVSTFRCWCTDRKSNQVHWDTVKPSQTSAKTLAKYFGTSDMEYGKAMF